jgi:class 3 adenylate cyclase
MSATLQQARDAMERRAWNEARAAFGDVDREDALEPGDLQLLADAAWWAGYPDDAVDALERAFAGYIAAGDDASAATVAIQLTYQAVRRMAGSVAIGWMGKAERLLDGHAESSAHAWLQMMRMVEAMLVRGEFEEGVELADGAIELARKHHVPGVEAQALGFKGYALVTMGDWQAGMALVDQATAAAVSGELDLRSACDVYCGTISCCTNIADYRRAREWTEEADRWMERHALGGYPGECRVYRAGLKRLGGDYAEAEQEARVACDELERYHLLDAVGMAYYEVGEVQRHRGDLEAAEASFMRAYEYGNNAQPGLAMTALAKGDVVAAAKAIGAALSGLGDGAGASDRLARARLLPAQVTIALAAGDLETARAATGELERIAADYERPAFEAAALTAAGAVELAEGRPEEAAETLDQAWRLWRDIDLPYESAQARVLLGRARQAVGDETTARMELTAARSGFERLGAALDVREIDELVGGGEPLQAGPGRRVTKTFMFTDIVTSTDLVELMGDAAWEDLLRWHDRALRSEIAGHGGQEVRSTGDGFFVAFDSAFDAVEAAVAIQRRLEKHRHQHGFAPWVRIGLHTAEATPQGKDFAGKGVHVAARVGDLGDREEIVASTAALEAAGIIRFPVSEPRTQSLKGVSEPVEVRTIEWR